MRHIRPGVYAPTFPRSREPLRREAFDKAREALPGDQRARVDEAERVIAKSIKGAGEAVAREIVAKLGILLECGVANEEVLMKDVLG